MKVSVVIPAPPDGERYLAEAIASARAEPETAEVLVVTAPAGESAGTAHAAGARTVDAGCDAIPTPKRNRGARAARHPVIAFLDADDRFVAGRLAALTASLGDAATGLVRAFVSPDRAAELVGRVQVDPTPRAGPLAGTLVVRREAFLALDGFRPELPSGETEDWLARACSAGFDIRQLDRVVLERRVHGANLSLTATDEQHAGYLRLARERIEQRRRA